MAIVEVRGAWVEYLVDGSGPALVLVHGTGGNAVSNWGHLVDRFSRHSTVVRPNYSGSGNTKDQGGLLSVEQLAEQVVEAAKAAGAASFDLVGFSLGAAVASAVAVRYPERVRSLVLLAGFSDCSDPYLKLGFSLWDDLIANNRHAMARLVLLTGFSYDFVANLREAEIDANTSAIVTGNNWDGMARQVALDLRLDIRDQLRAISQPTLVIGCTHDCIVPVRHPRQLATWIPGAEYAELATGHLAAIEQPETFAALVEKFVKRDRRL